MLCAVFTGLFFFLVKDAFSTTLMWRYLDFYLRCGYRLLKWRKNGHLWSKQRLSRCAREWHHFLSYISVLGNIPHLLWIFRRQTRKKSWMRSQLRSSCFSKKDSTQHWRCYTWLWAGRWKWPCVRVCLKRIFERQTKNKQSLITDSNSAVRHFIQLFLCVSPRAPFLFPIPSLKIYISSTPVPTWWRGTRIWEPSDHASLHGKWAPPDLDHSWAKCHNTRHEVIIFVVANLTVTTLRLSFLLGTTAAGSRPTVRLFFEILRLNFIILRSSRNLLKLVTYENL